jgi:hypothetical protein
MYSSGHMSIWLKVSLPAHDLSVSLPCLDFYSAEFQANSYAFNEYIA